MQGSDHDSDNCCLPDLFRHLQWAKPFPSHLNLLHAAMNPSPPNVSIAFKVQEWPEEVTGSNPRKISDGPLPTDSHKDSRERLTSWQDCASEKPGNDPPWKESIRLYFCDDTTGE